MPRVARGWTPRRAVYRPSVPPATVSYATPTLIQTASAATTGTGTITVNFNAAQPGNLLIFKLAWNTRVSDVGLAALPVGSSGNNFIGDQNGVINNTGLLRCRVFKKVAAAGENSVTVSCASGTDDMVGWVEEWFGLTWKEDPYTAAATGSFAPPDTGSLSGDPPTLWVTSGLIAIENDNSLSTPTNGYTLSGTVASTNATANQRVRLASVYHTDPATAGVSLTEGGIARGFAASLTTFIPMPGPTINPTVTFAPAYVRSVGKLIAIPSRTYPYHTFEGGTSGATVASTDSGNGVEFDGVTIGGDATFTYDNTRAHSGAQSGKIVTGTGNAAVGSYVASFPDSAEGWARLYVYCTGLPGALVRFMTFFGTDAGNCGSVEINFQGKFRVFYRGTTGTLGTTVIPLNQWVRVELHVVSDPTNGVVEIKIYTNPESDVADETISVTSVNTGSVLMSQVQFGNTAGGGTSATGFTFWVDDPTFSTRSWVGPLGALFTPAVTKRVGKLVAIGATFTAAISKVVARLLPQTVTFTPSVTKRLNRTLAQTVTFGVSLTKRSAEAIAVGVTFGVSLTKRMAEVIAVTVTFTVAMRRTVGKLLAQTVTFTTSVVKSVGKPISQTVTFSPVVSMIKAVNKLLAQGVTFTAAVVKSVGKPISQTVTFTVAVKRTVARSLAQAVNFAVSLTKQVPKVFALTVTFGVSVIRSIPKVIAFGVTFTAAVKRAINRTLSQSVTYGVALTKSVGKLLAQTVTFTAQVRKTVTKFISQTVTWTVSLTGIKAIFRSISVGVTFTVALAKPVTKLIALAVTYTVAVRRSLARTLSQGVTFAVQVAKKVSKTLALTATFSAAVSASKAVTKLLAQGVTFTVSVVRASGAVSKAIDLVVNFVPVVERTLGKTIRVGVTWLVDWVRFKFHPKPDVIGEITLKAQARGYLATNSDVYVDTYSDVYSGDTGMERGELVLAAHYQSDETGGGYVDDYEDVY